MKLDFSEFHDGFHSLWQCRGYPGGRRRHITNWWWFGGGRSRMRRWLYCWHGRHELTVWRKGGKVHGVFCGNCPHKATPAEYNEAVVKERNRDAANPPPFEGMKIDDWGDF